MSAFFVAAETMWRKWFGLAPVVLVTAFLAWWAIHAIYTNIGHPGATLDDAYIHFQYARALAEGHPMRYQAGEAISTGTTSALWPLLLAPFYLAGFRDEWILWPAWGLSFVALGMLAHEAYRLARPLTGEVAAVGAGALVLASGGFTWCAASGMEVVPFAWAIARTMRVAAEWAEANAGGRTKKRLRELVGLSWVSFLLRPEGAVFATAAAIVLIVNPAGTAATTSRWRGRAKGLWPLAAPLAVALFLRALSGSAASTAATVKLLVGSPYYAGAPLRDALGENLRVFFVTLLNGQVWSAEFIPPHGAWVAILGLVSIGVLGMRRALPWRAALIVLLALGMLIPCAYVTFLWNRLRYLWPFATGWLVGLACLARLAGDLLGSIRPRWRVATLLLAGVFVGLFASHLDGVIDDVGGSASGIDRQHVAMGRWAESHLPADARIGVNDTGAVAYFSHRRTFDVVGLTTASEGRYWVAGPASRFEHYERIHAQDPERLPTHFIVYPEWLACPAVLGAALYESTVLDATILGGQTMRAYVADYTLLGSGEAPWSGLARAPAIVVDALDVGDLESEREHGYELLGARDAESVARVGTAPSTDLALADGGRTRRSHERFVASLRVGVSTTVVARVESLGPARLRARAGDEELGREEIAGGDWTEVAFTIPGRKAVARTSIAIDAEPPVTTFHYWFVVAFTPPG